MSEIATLEKLELHLAQVITTETAPVAAPAPKAVEPAASVMNNGSQGSQLELFFSEIKYSTFVTAPKKPSPRSVREARSSNSSEGALKYSLKLH